ncbi:MAG: prepilin-type N-terminal cleavage/methylation domain-containing protein [Sedimentibacter saalensis]|uniref:PulJ/GspJ family protein n=1 Tax=Sedimentibacter saalensis TaxID=130788 RepID=UPI002B21ADA9|nr:prepilin-type N-terminal cleavage/methylation domain-containing protein [Sedimentibacter saalensis]MEA5095472.1 prepilin-type N-terminal cleavage/methylation domain-containing protein [Sedimentibacter saalensis]
MKRKISEKTRGFTLIEVILAVALLSFVIIIASNMFFLGNNAQKFTMTEYTLNSDLRKVTEKTNSIVRYSKAVFAVPYTFVDSTDVMDPDWDFLMVSDDGKRIVTMEYDEVAAKHVEKTVVEEHENLVYELFFEKDTAAKTDNILKYKINAYTTDDDGNKLSPGSPKLVFETTVESVNSIQVVDKGTAAAPSIALAYRDDGHTSGKGKNQIAYVTVIVDNSGSMLANPDGDYRYDRRGNRMEYNESRITKLREALVGSTGNPNGGIINQFAKEENIFISLVPFSTTANYPEPTSYDSSGQRHPIYEVYVEDKKDELVDSVDLLRGNGGTNTGDGLRQAYYLHDDFRTRMNASGYTVKDTDQVHHYMIMLVDGETTYEVENGTWEDGGSYQRTSSYVTRSRNRYYRYNWRTDWNFDDNNTAYTDPGNIEIDTEPDDEPLTFVRSDSNGSGSYRYRDLYGEENSPVNGYSITGNGSSIINNSIYERDIGSMIKSFETNGVKSYIIGYAADLGTHIETIGTKIGTESAHIYKYDDPGFDLDEIFKNIATDIMADFWLVSGPQIITIN